MNEAPVQIGSRSRVALAAVGVLLLVAAGAKLQAIVFGGHASTFTQLPGVELVGRPAYAVNVALVVGEALLGAWLIAAWHPRWAWRLAAFVFIVFTAITAWALAAGRESCGCFGVVESSPWFTLVIDLAALIALLVGRPKGRDAITNRRTPRGLTLAAVAGLGVPLLTVIALQVAITQFPESALAQASDATRHVNPKDWIGQRWPLLDDIDIAPPGEVSEGSWEVLLHRHGCPRCEQILARWEDEAADKPEVRRAVIEVSSSQSDHGTDADRGGDGLFRGRLRNSGSWFFGTPVVLRVEGGRVTAVSDDSDHAGSEANAKVVETPPVEEQTGVIADIASGQIDYDFGYVESGQTYGVTLVLHNPLETEIVIRDIQIECACTRLTDPPETLPAQAGYGLGIRFEPPDLEGPYGKKIALVTDHPDLPVIQVNIRARIDQPLAVESAGIDVEPQAEDRGLLGVAIVSNDGSAPVKLLYATSQTPGVFAVMPREPIPAEGQAEIQIRRSPGNQSGDDAAVSIQITTDLPKQKTLTLKIDEATAYP